MHTQVYVCRSRSVYSYIAFVSVSTPYLWREMEKTKDGTILGPGEYREDIRVVIEPCFNFSVFFAFVFKIRRFKQSPSFFLWFLGHSSQS